MDRMNLWRAACAAVALVAGLLAAPAGAQVQYIHTDALGSVVAVTDANRNVIERREFAPYGDQLNAPAADRGLGYTGHVEDGLTGLTYMQQRYYDPAIGRFLSVDPVGPLSNPINHFGRYHYANNNPYKYTDPDGQVPILIPLAVVAWRAYSAYDTVSTAASNISTVTNSSASTGDRVLAGAQLLGSAVGGSVGRQAVGRVVKAADAAKEAGVVANGIRGRASEARVLNELGLTKNTTTVSTAEGSSIPDALTASMSVEVKDAANVSLTRQLRIQTEAARASGRESVLITGENTCVSGACSRAFDTIIRRPDLGPRRGIR